MSDEERKKFQDALDAAKELINWYESDHERSSYDDEDVPSDLVELENTFQNAMEALKAVKPTTTPKSKKKPSQSG